MKTSVKHFSGSIELQNVTTLDNRIAAQLGITGARRADSFSVWIGWDVASNGRPLRGYDGALPMTRRVFYKCRPSLHECNAKCLNGKHDGACECQCGGRNHGLGQLIPSIN